MQPPGRRPEKTIQTIAQKGIADLETLQNAVEEGKLDILDARRPLTDAHRAIIEIQDERFASLSLPCVTLSRQPASTTFLSPVLAREMEREWRGVLQGARKKGRVVCRHQFRARDFALAQHMLQHVRHVWRLPAAMAYGWTTAQVGKTRPHPIQEKLYLVPFYKVLQPRRRVVLPHLKGVERVFSDYNR